MLSTLLRMSTFKVLGPLGLDSKSDIDVQIRRVWSGLVWCIDESVQALIRMLISF